MPITSTNYTKALQEGVYKWNMEAYKDHQEEFSKLFMTERSRKAYEEIVGTSGFGMFGVKGEGNSVSYDTSQQGFIWTFRHLTYASGFTITEEMIEDDLYDTVGKRLARNLAKAARQTTETVGHNILNRAFNSSYTYGDGKELCATDHPNMAGGVYQNELTTAADFSEAAVEQACIDIGKWTDDRGLKMNAMPVSVHGPVDLQFEFERVLMTNGQVYTADNTLNAVKSMSKFPGGYHIHHYLTDTDAWFIKTDVEDGLIRFLRRGYNFQADNDFDTKNAKFNATFRESFGVGNPKGIYGSPGA